MSARVPQPMPTWLRNRKVVRRTMRSVRKRSSGVVVVTGASAGVGRAIVREFAKRGASIGLLARGRDGLEGARREVEAAGGKALALEADVADADHLAAAAQRVERELGPINV